MYVAGQLLFLKIGQILKLFYYESWPVNKTFLVNKGIHGELRTWDILIKIALKGIAHHISAAVNAMLHIKSYLPRGHTFL